MLTTALKYMCYIATVTMVIIDGIMATGMDGLFKKHAISDVKLEDRFIVRTFDVQTITECAIACIQDPDDECWGFNIEDKDGTRICEVTQDMAGSGKMNAASGYVFYEKIQPARPTCVQAAMNRGELVLIFDKLLWSYGEGASSLVDKPFDKTFYATDLSSEIATRFGGKTPQAAYMDDRDSSNHFISGNVDYKYPTMLDALSTPDASVSYDALSSDLDAIVNDPITATNYYFTGNYVTKYNLGTSTSTSAFLLGTDIPDNIFFGAPRNINAAVTKWPNVILFRCHKYYEWNTNTKTIVSQGLVAIPDEI
ncbi:unnamed protein product [Owenia fusiformis]|uniref:Uncharacterized protein n=1 Tax=Owenia fusiformis TaxID=6347 RepID=A0A8S4NQW5_OWEFU|nr:unnamed protein product [Owenia fusiformis]